MPKKPEAMMWYCEAWLASPSVLAMAPAARSGYFDILNAIWIGAGRIAERKLEGASRLGPKLWRKHRDEIMECLVEHPDGGWTQSRVMEEYERTINLLNARSKGGRKGARRRWQTDGLPNGSPSGSPSGSPNRTPNAKPMQTETETETETREPPKVALSGPPPGDEPSEGVPLPDEAFDEILALWVNPRDVAGGRIAYHQQIDSAVNPQSIVAGMLAAARLVRERMPAEKWKFQPNAREFFGGKFMDDWERIVANETGGMRRSEAERLRSL